MPEPSILDERLAEIDRRLRSIQSDLKPVEADTAVASAPPRPVTLRPAPALVDASPKPQPESWRGPEPGPQLDPGPPPAPARGPEIAELTGRLVALADAHERLLELHRELLSQYAEVLEHRAAETATLAVTAGPFSTTEAVRVFENALAALPGVSGVAVREFLDDDRVQVDVRLLPR